LAPEYEKAATNLKGLVKVGAVNCDDEKELAMQFEVKGLLLLSSTIDSTPFRADAVRMRADDAGFPTLKFFLPRQKKPEDYAGPRTAAAIAQYVRLARIHACV
jgi:protein disulfide-isomerase A6